MAGKTLQELEDAGYEHVSSEMGENDEATYTVSLGLYEYNLLLNETYTVYQQHDDSGFIGDLTVKSVSQAVSGENPEEAIQKLIEAMPEHAEEIRTFAEIFSTMYGQDQK